MSNNFEPEYDYFNESSSLHTIKRQGPGYVKTGADAGSTGGQPTPGPRRALTPIAVSREGALMPSVLGAGEASIVSGGYQETLEPEDAIIQEAAQVLEPSPVPSLTSSTVDPAILILGLGLLTLTFFASKN